MSTLTPLMKQYWDIKSLHQDKVLLFRMGDFFEMFHDDAVRAAPIIGIALTQRNKKSQDETPMCGMPHHSIAGPINKLLAAGLKVAICDQLEDPKLAKGLVKRGVTRILTPGMVYDSDTLDGTKQHYLVSFDESSMSFLDSTTGEAFYFTGDKVDWKRFLNILPVVEVVMPESANELIQGLPKNIVVSIWDEYASRDLEVLQQAPKSAALLVSYVTQLAGEEVLKTIKPFVERDFAHRLELSPVVMRHLEVFSTYKGEGQGSLFFAINRTQTSAGSRMLRQWLSFPLQDKERILQRQEQVEFWRQDLANLKRVRQILGQMGDIERRITKISLPTANGRDLLALAGSIHAGLSALEVIGQSQRFSVLRDLAYQIENTLVEDPPLSTKQGYLVRPGVSSELDELIELSTNAHALVLKMEAEERDRTGISSLKIRYNNVFGYYIEITNTHKDKVPKNYQRKQTLTNAERYCTDELIELERKVLSAQTKRADLEFEYYEALRNTILKNGPLLLQFSVLVSEMDVYSSLAWLSLEEKYVRPEFTTTGRLSIKASRHPVIEQFVSQFISNDIEIKPSGCLLLTGPNMAGKSTLMRQVALTIIMAQMGSYVPAESAVLPLFDSIFTRIGASDMLSEGLSTFMVEMTETAQMLKSATPKSLLILDEVGRGTSTFDGMCLAQAILEHIITEIRCQTFFATHYHELTSLENSFPQIYNAHMSVAEKNGEIRFLHSLAKGPATKSYGVHVAELAGVPSAVTKRAKSLLKEVESKKHQASSQLNLMDLELAIDLDEPQATETVRLNPELESFLRELKNTEVLKLSPLEALNQMAQWQKRLEQI
ncbi:MAG: DNA mismatch repair protein MutS [Bdellovibrionia bacterium]